MHHNFQRDKDYLRIQTKIKKPLDACIQEAFFIFVCIHRNARDDEHELRSNSANSALEFADNPVVVVRNWMAEMTEMKRSVIEVHLSHADMMQVDENARDDEHELRSNSANSALEFADNPVGA